MAGSGHLPPSGAARRGHQCHIIPGAGAGTKDKSSIGVKRLIGLGERLGRRAELIRPGFTQHRRNPACRPNQPDR